MNAGEKDPIQTSKVPTNNLLVGTLGTSHVKREVVVSDSILEIATGAAKKITDYIKDLNFSTLNKKFVLNGIFEGNQITGIKLLGVLENIAYCKYGQQFANHPSAAEARESEGKIAELIGREDLKKLNDYIKKEFSHK